MVLAARQSERLEEFASELTDRGATSVQTADFDAADTASHATLVNRLFDESPDLDVVIQAFGVLGDQEDFDRDPQAAAEAGVNYIGTVSTGLAVAERFRRQGHGTLVVLSSVAGARVRRGTSSTARPRPARTGSPRARRDALVDAGGKVLVVRPGFVHTSMTEGMDPAPFSTTAAAVADAHGRRPAIGCRGGVRAGRSPVGVRRLPPAPRLRSGGPCPPGAEEPALAFRHGATLGRGPARRQKVRPRRPVRRS